jgi:hypothetical protein
MRRLTEGINDEGEVGERQLDLAFWGEVLHPGSTTEMVGASQPMLPGHLARFVRGLKILNEKVMREETPESADSDAEADNSEEDEESKDKDQDSKAKSESTKAATRSKTLKDLQQGGPPVGLTSAWIWDSSINGGEPLHSSNLSWIHLLSWKKRPRLTPSQCRATLKT